MTAPLAAIQKTGSWLEACKGCMEAARDNLLYGSINSELLPHCLDCGMVVKPSIVNEGLIRSLA
jgi:NAD-dependent SIR2 family protein deacetylase